MSEITGIVFDLDGVICFTDQYHYEAWKMLADREHIPFDKQINERLRGVSRRACLEIILERASRTYTEAEKEEMATFKNEEYRRLLSGMTEEDLSPEVKNTLEELKRRGLKLAIGSSSRNAKMILERIGLIDFFDAISDGTNITKSKPDPEVFLKAAEMLGLAPESCLVVEDAMAGIDAACAGGFHNAGIGSAANYARTEHRLNRFVDILNCI